MACNGLDVFGEQYPDCDIGLSCLDSGDTSGTGYTCQGAKLGEVCWSSAWGFAFKICEQGLQCRLSGPPGLSLALSGESTCQQASEGEICKEEAYDW